MTENRNMILAIVLSALVLIGWSMIADRFMPTAGPQTQKVENGEVERVPQPQAEPTPDKPKALKARALVLR